MKVDRNRQQAGWRAWEPVARKITWHGEQGTGEWACTQEGGNTLCAVTMWRIRLRPVGKNWWCLVDIWRTGEATIEKDVRERARKENERLLRLRFVFSVAAAQPTWPQPKKADLLELTKLYSFPVLSPHCNTSLYFKAPPPTKSHSPASVWSEFPLVLLPWHSVCSNTLGSLPVCHISAPGQDPLASY